MTDTPSLPLNDGRTIPALGLGTYKIPEAHAALVVRQAVDLGYRLVDTAAIYGNEMGVGSGLADEPEIFLTTKLWNDRQGDAFAAFEESLALLGRESIDCYLIHWPAPEQDLYVEAWKALVRLREEGRVLSIGVSNFQPDHLERIIDATGVVPALNQIELHPGWQQQELRATHERLGIVTQSWSPLGQGSTLRHPEIARLAEKHGRSAAQVILRWHLQHGFSVIPKAGDPHHLADNIAALDWTLAGDDMAAIDALDDPKGRIGPDPLRFG